MAKTGNFVDNATVEHPEAYARVVLVNLDYGAQNARADVAIYHSQSARDSGAPPVHTVIYSFDTESPVTFEQMFGDALEYPEVCPRSVVYCWMDAQPEWLGWIDA